MNSASAQPATPTVPRAVPSYTVHALQPKRGRYCVCVFVLNEDGRLQPQLARMREHAAGLDIVIADGGSSDGSTDPALLAELGVNTLLVKTGPGALGAQMRMAFAWALERGYEGVIVVDGNNKDDPAALPAFAQALAAGFDHVQGSRFVPGGVSRNLPALRWLGLRLLHAPLISLAARFPYTDTTNGFRAYSARLLDAPATALFREVFAGYELHYYLAIRAARCGFRVTEIPVTRSYPDHGPLPSKISPLRGNLRVLGCLFRACSGAYDP